MKHLSISLLIALFALSSHAPAAAADTTNYDTAWTYVYDGGKRVAMRSGLGDITIDVARTARGVYFVKTTIAAGMVVAKVIVR
jgi:hypothetical protein